MPAASAIMRISRGGSASGLAIRRAPTRGRALCALVPEKVRSGHATFNFKCPRCNGLTASDWEAGMEARIRLLRFRIAGGTVKELRDQFMLADAGHIVVVDDDLSLRQLVIGYLEDHNIPTKPASNRTELNRHLNGTVPSLIILDLRLGQDDGLDMLREIRSHSDVPVIITTGHRPDEIDRIVGLELGADDYIIKPFSLRELLARVRAVLRRQEMGRLARAHNPERGGY